MLICTSASGFGDAVHAKRKVSASVCDARDIIFELARPLRAFAMFLVGDRIKADDLVEATLRKAWEEATSLQPKDSLRAWLFTILRNDHYSGLRQSAGGIDNVDGNRRPLLFGESRNGADFQTCFAALPIHQREALILMVAEGFSAQDAAAICGCSVGTMTRRLHRGQRKLAGTGIPYNLTGLPGVANLLAI